MAAHGRQQPTFVQESIPRALPDDPVSRQDIETVLERGWVILENCFTKAEAEEAKAEVRRLMGEQFVTGRNPFEGLDTTRIYSLLNKTRVFDKFCMLPRVIALNDYFLEPGYQLSAFHTIEILPGEKAQELHHDDGFVRLSRPRPPLGSAIMVAFDDFLEENGATRMVPGSHLWETGRRPKQEDTIPAVCPAGSAVYFVATTWHGGGGNRTDKSRMSATVQYCQPYIRPIENQYLAVDPRRLQEINPKIVSMMGYDVYNNFIGYTDGLNPRRAGQRMVEWLQKPLEKAPPTFAAKPASKL